MSTSSKSEELEESPSPNRVGILTEFPEICYDTVADFQRTAGAIIQKGNYVQCSIVRQKRGLFNNNFYQLLDPNQNVVFSATEKTRGCSLLYRIIEPKSGNLVGTIISNAKKLNYSVDGLGYNFSIEYTENFLGRNGARSFKMKLENGKIFVNRPPILISGEFYLDFHGLNALQSIKNFICVQSDDFSKESCILAKLSDDLFYLQISQPFSLFHGFALSLTSLHTGLYHR